MENKIISESEIDRMVEYLNSAARSAIYHVRNNTPDSSSVQSDIRNFQEDFCYLIDEIQRGPVYFVTKNVQRANLLIEQFKAYFNV